MFNSKIAVIILESLFVFMVFNASAQWSPGGTMVYMGDLNLAGSTGTSGSAPYALISAPIDLPMNNSSMVNSSMNNSTMYNSTMNNSKMNSASSLAPLDLSRYASDRANKSLAGYKNIMYPIAESRGSTTSTAGGGGCGCG
jgi:hypothetical protein